MGLYSWFANWWQRPGWVAIARWRKAARKGERYVAEYEFPAHLEHRVARHDPRLAGNWTEVERGLREWFICCAWRGQTVLGMPSRAVDEAWHEFILDSMAYTRFCNAVFGSYLHHTPDEGMATPMPEALGNTVRAWDRSEASTHGESILWDLDRKLHLSDPIGISPLDRGTARSAPSASAPPFAAYAAPFASGDYVAVGLGGGGEGDGDGGGGGCGGGGCGGGGN